jgi:hypothetical protein
MRAYCSLHSDLSLVCLLLPSTGLCLVLTWTQVKVKVTLWLTVSQPVSLGVEPHLGLMTRYLLLFDSYGFVFCGAPSSLSFVYAAGSCQCSLSRVRVPWDLRPYFTVSDLRLAFSSPPTTRRVTVEVFDPTSTRVCSTWTQFCSPLL